MSDLAPTFTKTRNLTGRETCAACIEGWVDLAGTTTIGRTTYTRGMAPCKWCEQGLARWQRHPELESRFTGGDIIPPPTPGKPVRHPKLRPLAAEPPAPAPQDPPSAAPTPEPVAQHPPVDEPLPF